MRLKDIITQYRTEHEMSQRKFAQKCGLSNSQISYIEKGVNSLGDPFVPTTDTLVKIASGIGVSFNDLISMIEDVDLWIEAQNTPEIPLKISEETLKYEMLGNDATDSEWEDLKNYRDFLVSRRKK